MRKSIAVVLAFAFCFAAGTALAAGKAKPASSKPGKLAAEIKQVEPTPVKSLENLPEGMVGWEIPAQTYAVLPVQGLPDLGRVMNHFCGEWLAQSDEYEGVDGPMFELYPPTFNSDDSLLYLYFAVRRK